MESEFMAATEGAKFSKWLMRLLNGFGLETVKPVPMLEDNSATIYLSKHPSLNGSRSRHMEIRWHWLQEAVRAGDIILWHIPTAGQPADILTKPTPKHVHDALVPTEMGQQAAYTPCIKQALAESDMTTEMAKQAKQEKHQSTCQSA